MPNIYKKKNPRTPYIKQIILYSIMLILCIIVGAWQMIIVFVALLAFSGYMLYKNWDKGTYSLADYIHEYDDEFPTESAKTKEKREARDLQEKRQQEYEDYIAAVEDEYDNFDYGDEEYEEDDE